MYYYAGEHSVGTAGSSEVGHKFASRQRCLENSLHFPHLYVVLPYWLDEAGISITVPFTFIVPKFKLKIPVIAFLLLKNKLYSKILITVFHEEIFSCFVRTKSENQLSKFSS